MPGGRLKKNPNPKPIRTSTPGVEPPPVIGEYNVEDIVGKRHNKELNRMEYKVKWQGYPHSQNTWEPMDHLENCTDMIAAFEAKTKRQDLINKIEKEGKHYKPRWELSGYRPKQIIGATKVDNKIHFLVEWETEGDNAAEFGESDLLPNEVLKLKWPLILIDFYERRLIWSDSSNRAPPPSRPSHDDDTDPDTPMDPNQ